MTALSAPGFPETAVRDRARRGEAAAFPPHEEYGRAVFGSVAGTGGDPLDALRIVPPVLMPRRLEKLVELGREPLPEDVDLTTRLGGFGSALPLYVSAFGSTSLASDGLGLAVARQAGALGVPLVVGENVVPVTGYGRVEESAGRAMLLDRIRAYAEESRSELGGVVVQQSTEDADAEVWNLVYSDPNVTPLLEAGRLGFELKVGQGAKPGLGGMTLVDTATAERLADTYALGTSTGSRVHRSSSPGTFTSDILGSQVRLMRNNFPRCRIWVKLPPGRDVADAAAIAWAEGADAVTVDGAEAGTGWAPTSFLDVGLPLGECLARIGRPATSLLASGRMWEGTRATKALALGATGIGLGRAALLAVHERRADGLVNLVRCLALELRLLISALGKYAVADLGREDLWPAPCGHPPPGTPQP
ncbi:glutamate synthase-related protein [Umezawaea sp.]|uniref:glutamate synthase-related protein n=1 Tax=Umezawaea sp. TaxID=1955258 RepID=UPI002ED53A42